jgi:hypothetical protein
MSIEHVLAVVPVSDLQASSRWYEALFGRPADNNPMPTLAEWQVVPGGWVQIFIDTTRAGSGLLNFAVDDLQTYVAGLRPIGDHRSRRQHDQLDRRIPGRVLIGRQRSAALTTPNTARVD